MTQKQGFFVEFTVNFVGNWVYKESSDDDLKPVALKTYSLTKELELPRVPELGEEFIFTAKGKKAKIKIGSISPSKSNRELLCLTGIPKEVNMGNVVSVSGRASSQSIKVIEDFINVFRTDGWKVQEHQISQPNLVEDLLANV